MIDYQPTTAARARQDLPSTKTRVTGRDSRRATRPSPSDVRRAALLGAALALAGKHLHVLAVRGNKAPASSCPHGVHDATIDPDEIRRMFAAPDAVGVAVALGRSGLIVVDVDRHLNGPDGLDMWWRLRAGQTTPATWSASTPSGGAHHAFTEPPAGLPELAAKLAPGVDLLHGDRYIVAPWSGAPDRAWLRDPWTTAPAEIPAWIIELARRPDPTPTPTTHPTTTPAPDRLAQRIMFDGWENASGRRTDGYLPRLERAGRGDRNRTLYQAAAESARLGMDEETAWSACRSACETNGLIRDDGEAQTRRTFDSGRKRGASQGVTPRTPRPSSGGSNRSDWPATGRRSGADLSRPAAIAPADAWLASVAAWAQAFIRNPQRRRSVVRVACSLARTWTRTGRPDVAASVRWTSLESGRRTGATAAALSILSAAGWIDRTEEGGTRRNPDTGTLEGVPTRYRLTRPEKIHQPGTTTTSTPTGDGSPPVSSVMGSAVPRADFEYFPLAAAPDAPAAYGSAVDWHLRGVAVDVLAAVVAEPGALAGEPFGLADVAERAHVSTATARRYLDRGLGGAVAVADEGSRGRGHARTWHLVAGAIAHLHRAAAAVVKVADNVYVSVRESVRREYRRLAGEGLRILTRLVDHVIPGRRRITAPRVVPRDRLRPNEEAEIAGTYHRGRLATDAYHAAAALAWTMGAPTCEGGPA